MPEHLVFRLAGPLAAWGEIAVGEIRSSWLEPSKSAVLGLVAAALGVDRSDTERHRRLHEDLAFAVRVDGERRLPLRDYHTAQAPGARKGRRWGTRAEEVADKQALKTVLSTRWYWQDFAATAALAASPSGQGREPLAAIKSALERPRYVLYLGRKACPPGRPLRPQIIDGPDAPAAMTAYDAAEAEAEGALGVVAPPGGEVWADAALDPARRAAERRVRRDALRDRAAWTFADRAEARLEAPSAETPSKEDRS
jgi:CRISPR system Cascade subunit CasD